MSTKKEKRYDRLPFAEERGVAAEQLIALHHVIDFLSSSSQLGDSAGIQIPDAHLAFLTFLDDSAGDVFERLERPDLQVRNDEETIVVEVPDGFFPASDLEDLDRGSLSMVIRRSGNETETAFTFVGTDAPTGMEPDRLSFGVSAIDGNNLIYTLSYRAAGLDANYRIPISSSISA